MTRKEKAAMTAGVLWAPGLVALLLSFGPVAAAQAPAAAKDATTPASQALAEKIDEHLAKRWALANVKPAPAAEDPEFLRRIYLDLAGRVPSVTEARAFLKDARPDKRARLVEQLLASPRYVTHFANVWRALLIPEANNNFLVRLQQENFEGWLKKRVASNTGYDQLARDLITAPISAQGFGALYGGAGEPTPLAFYSAKEFLPENLAAGTARVFLGVSVECAQCHNHPFAKWKREQFWSFAAFYSGMQSQRVMDFLLPGKEIPDRKQLTIPGTDKVVQARFLDETEPAWKADVATRAVLAEWVTSPTNPYFSRTAVNRAWAYFFGTGLVEPVDEMVGASTTSSHPELLELLAKEFAAHQFDMKFLITTLTSTRAYQLTSARSLPLPAAEKAEGQDDPTLFARMPLRGLTAEQLFDSLVMATGYRDVGGGNDLLTAITGGNRSARSAFLAKFSNQTERATKAQLSILQALSLMNGKVVADATSLENSETLAALVDAPFMTTPERIEALYLATLSRQPSPKELNRAVQFVQDAVKQGANGNDEAAQRSTYNNALADVFWALLNTPEFALNH
jgi:hypothetical protein